MVDIKQQELDFVEQQILTDIFGGYNPENLVLRYGFFKMDLTPKVQKAIGDFEKIVKPIMDENGYVDSREVKKYINEKIIHLPDGKYRLIEIYRRCQPFVNTALSYVKGF